MRVADRPGRLRRLHRRVRTQPGLSHAYRVVVGVLGGAIVLVGLALLPLPGPGWLVIFLGLGLLATEFVWAQRLLQYARARVRSWTGWVERQSTAVRALLASAVLLVLAAAAGGYVAWRGLPDWLPFAG